MVRLKFIAFWCSAFYAFSATTKFGISFSPAGLLTPFHFGVAYQLKSLGLIDDKTSLAGSSGGALAAVTCALNVDFDALLEACERIALQFDAGSTLRQALDDTMFEILPFDSAEMLRNRSGAILVAYTEVVPFMKGRVVDKFQNRNDLMDVLRASCNIPFYFTGKWPCVSVRGVGAVDGFFAITRSRFGCPPTLAPVELIVSPFDPQLVGLAPEPTILNEGPQQLHVISPALLSPDDWPFSLRELTILALRPPTENIADKALLLRSWNSSPLPPPASSNPSKVVYRALFNAGAKAALNWCSINSHVVGDLTVHSAPPPRPNT